MCVSFCNQGRLRLGPGWQLRWLLRIFIPGQSFGSEVSSEGGAEETGGLFPFTEKRK